MVSTFSPNLNLEEPGRGDQVGTWDTPVNGNMTIIDSAYGATVTIALTNANVTLSAAQYQCSYLVFTGTITANIAITFPYIGSGHTIENRTVGTFNVTLQTTNVSAEAICCPPYEPFDILTRASTAGVRYRNFGRVGDTWEYMGSSVPIWVSGCTIPPYLNCDGTAFSSATYPALATILSTTVTPDSRGRSKATLNQGQGRITTAGSSIDGNTNFSAGGVESMTIGASNLSSTIIRTDADGNRAFGVNNTGAATTVVVGAGVSVYPSNQFSPLLINPTPAAVSITNMPPTYIAGLTLVRAA